MEEMQPVRRGGVFENPGHHEDRSWWDVLRWKTTTRAERWPAWVEGGPGAVPARPAAGFAVTWAGHATFLIRGPGGAVLTDPHWSACAGPFGRVGPRRVHAPGVAWDALPEIDAVLMSHDHYDHWDMGTLRRIARRWPGAKLVTPLGYGALAGRAGFGAGRRVELNWWGETEVAGLRVTATPARHWSNRLSGRRNGRLWGGYFLRETGAAADVVAGGVYFAGDTAYDARMFGEIRAKLGEPALALLPIGAYAPRWFMREQHCDPAEAVRIHGELGARRSVGMHWGTFPMTDEGREAPAAALAEAARAAGLAEGEFGVMAPGETVRTAG